MKIALESSLDILNGPEVRNRLENHRGDIYKLLREVYDKGITEVFLYRPSRVVENDNIALGDRITMRPVGEGRLRFSYAHSYQKKTDFDDVIKDSNGGLK